MAYSRTTWVDGVTKLGPTNLNNIEAGLVTADANATLGVANAATATTNAATAQTTANAAIPKSLVTTAGDLIYGTASGVLARLGIGAAGTVLGGGASAPSWAFPPGYEFGYAEKTTDTSITATTAGTANTVATTSSITIASGDIVLIQLSTAAAFKGTTWIKGVIYEDSAQVSGDIFYDAIGTVGQIGWLRRTPAAGAHTYSFRAYVDAGTGTIGATGFCPAFIRVTKV